MTVSSRTPAPEMDRCPTCRGDVHFEPPPLFGETPCPHCGHLLWFVCSLPATRIFDFEAAKTIRNRIIDVVAQRLGIERKEVTGDPRQWELLARDPLDAVELAMDLEDGSVLE